MHWFSKIAYSTLGYIVLCLALSARAMPVMPDTSHVILAEINTEKAEDTQPQKETGEEAAADTQTYTEEETAEDTQAQTETDEVADEDTQRKRDRETEEVADEQFAPSSATTHRNVLTEDDAMVSDIRLIRFSSNQFLWSKQILYIYVEFSLINIMDEALKESLSLFNSRPSIALLPFRLKTADTWNLLRNFIGVFLQLIFNKCHMSQIGDMSI